DDDLGDEEQTDDDQAHGADQARPARPPQQPQGRVDRQRQDGDLDQVARAHGLIELDQAILQCSSPPWSIGGISSSSRANSTTASGVGARSWTRTIWAARRARANHPAARAPASRSPTARPRSLPRKPLRDTPRQTGRPSRWNSTSRASSWKLW